MLLNFLTKARGPSLLYHFGKDDLIFISQRRKLGTREVDSIALLPTPRSHYSCERQVFPSLDPNVPNRGLVQANRGIIGLHLEN